MKQQTTLSVRSFAQAARKSLAVFATIGALALSLGCESTPQLIDHISVRPTENLEIIRVSLVFTQNIRSQLAGAYALKDYGTIFINPFTASTPFEVGFDLNTAIVNDQDYVALTPTEFLPNGVPIGIGYAMAEVRAETPISDKFDIYGYVDILRANWLGVAGIFNFLNDQYFPAGLSVSQSFVPDAQGRPSVLASVFGPSLNTNGSLRRAGGIALFANVRALIQQMGGNVGGPLKPFDAKPLPGVQLAGPAAAQYEGRMDLIRQLEGNVAAALNANPR